MEAFRNGKFSLVLNKMSDGLSKVNNVRNNSDSLSVLEGFVIADGILQTQDEIIRIDTSDLVTTFPYPQMFRLTNLILVINDTDIYEYNVDADSLVLKITTSPGSTWTVVDFHDFVYMTNGTVVVLRNAESKIYSISNDYPTGMALCNYNSQVLVGSPDAGYVI